MFELRDRRRFESPPASAGPSGSGEERSDFWDEGLELRDGHFGPGEKRPEVRAPAPEVLGRGFASPGSVSAGCSGALVTRGRFRAAASVLAATTAVALVSALVAGGTGGSRTLRSVARASSHSSGPTGHARRGPTASSPAGSAGGSGTDLEPGSATTAPAASAGGAPVISAISPAQGLAGQTVVLSGSNFMSSDGQILAEFAGHPAPTDCPVQTSCTVTVPEIAGSVSEVGVTLTTASGTSNAVSFTYG